MKEKLSVQAYIEQFCPGWRNICTFAYDAKLGYGPCKPQAEEIGREFFEKVCANNGNGCGHREIILAAQPIANVINGDYIKDK
jgi:hypothetical protein